MQLAAPLGTLNPEHPGADRVSSLCQINKQNEQMHALLAIALTMYPMRIDESIHLQLREKYGDKMLRMQKGDAQVYEELFSYACPKFLSPVVPNYDNVHPNYHKEPFLQQLKVFADEVQQQAQLSTIRSFLKLYTTMPVAKLAGFLDLTEQEFRIQLLVFKHKMKNLVWTSGISALDGEFQSASEVDFYIDKVGICHLLSFTQEILELAAPTFVPFCGRLSSLLCHFQGLAAHNEVTTLRKRNVSR